MEAQRLDVLAKRGVAPPAAAAAAAMDFGTSYVSMEAMSAWKRSVFTYSPNAGLPHLQQQQQPQQWLVAPAVTVSAYKRSISMFSPNAGLPHLQQAAAAAAMVVRKCYVCMEAEVQCSFAHLQQPAQVAAALCQWLLRGGQCRLPHAGKLWCAGAALHAQQHSASRGCGMQALC
jgi:hypothetical protein